MAISNRLLGILAAVASCLSIWSVGSALVRTPRRLQMSTAEQKARSALADSATLMGLQLRNQATLNRVDSALAGYQGKQVPSVLNIGAPMAAARLAESLYTSIPKPVDPAFPMRLVLLGAPPEGSPWPRGALESFALISDTPGDQTCATVSYLSAGDSVLDAWGRDWWQWVPWQGAVGPCWFLAQFGPPGPQVRAWLDSRYWDVAAAIPPVYHRKLQEETVIQPEGLLDRLLGNVTGTFYDESIVLEGCAADRPELCEAAIVQPPLPPGLVPVGVVGNGRMGYLVDAGRRSWMFEMPRSRSAPLLASMVDDLGPTRFAAFWTSDAPVAEAFAASAGMSLGDWFRLQLRAQRREAGLPDPPGAPVWPSAIGFLALALVGTLWHAKRREVR